MATIYTLEQLRQIHKNREAEFNVKYSTIDRTWVGDEKGRLLETTAVDHIEESDEQFNTINIILQGDEDDPEDLGGLVTWYQREINLFVPTINNPPQLAVKDEFTVNPLDKCFTINSDGEIEPTDNIEDEYWIRSGNELTPKTIII